MSSDSIIVAEQASASTEMTSPIKPRLDAEGDEEEIFEDAKESKMDEPATTGSRTTKNDATMTTHKTRTTTASTTTKTTTMATTSWLREHAKEFMDEWTRGGLSRHIDLPMICVLGDTSSGKSSVLSSLIGLELPSASTLTTKCPILIQLHQLSSIADNDDGDDDTNYAENDADDSSSLAHNKHRNRKQRQQQQQQAIVDIQWHVNGSSRSVPSPRQRKRLIEQQRSKSDEDDIVGKSKTISTTTDESLSSSMTGENPLPSSPSEISTTTHTRTTTTSSSPSCPPPPPPPAPKWKPRTITQNLEIEVPACIQEAQDVILKYRETLVAPDVICITLWSADCSEELTLVDLPGLVQYQHQSDSSLLGQVEQVVLEYVHNPRSILVPVIAAPTNIHNSKVLQWCHQVDPTTRRTVPVLTKPDLMDPGSEQDVVNLLLQSDGPAEQKKLFHHGFFLVMNRGQALLDAGATLEMGLKMEQEYFANTMPWRDTVNASGRVGIPALRRRLATALWHVMQDCIPDIWQELQDQYQDVQHQLKKMGTLFRTRADQRKFYHNLSQQLVSQVAGTLSGKGPLGRTTALNNRSGPPTRESPCNRRGGGATIGEATALTVSPLKPGAAKLHAACHAFFQEIQASSLATIDKLIEGAGVVVSSPGQAQEVRGEIVHIDTSGLFACVDFIDEKDHTTDVLFDGIDYLDEEADFEEDEVWCEDGKRVFIGRAGGRFDSLRKIPTTRIRTDPSWLQEKMSLFRTDDLACFINVVMFQHIVADFVQDEWVSPCCKLVDTLQDILLESLHQAFRDQLHSTKRFPLLEEMVQSTCQRVAQRLIATARTQVKEHLEMEEQHPYTQDEVLLQAMNRARFKALKSDLEMQLRLDQEGVVYDTQAIQAILARVFSKHQRSNWMAEQMELVLSCYGQVATQRVLDRTPQICWQTCRNLPKVLQEELGCITDDILEKCLWESPVTKKKFQELTEHLVDLQRAMDSIKALR